MSKNNTPKKFSRLVSLIATGVILCTVIIEVLFHPDAYWARVILHFFTEIGIAGLSLGLLGLLLETQEFAKYYKEQIRKILVERESLLSD
jgi:hypothetical protein